MSNTARKSSIHFELSERKLLLRIFDLLSVVGGVFLVSNFFHLDYITVTPENWYWIIVLLIYLTFFANVFEWYDLLRSSKYDQIAPNIILACSVTVLFYLLTPRITPVLPESRIQILYFYFAITIPILIWRWAYIFFITSPRYHKNVLLIGNTNEVNVMTEAIGEATSSINVIGFINTGKNGKAIEVSALEEFKDFRLKEIIKENNVSEVIVASNESEDIAKSIFDDLIHLLESGFTIREFTQVYEEITNRIPVQHIGKDFYRYFPFSRSNQNKLYLLYHRLMDIVLSIIGLALGLVLLPIVLIGNVMGNRGPLFYSQKRVGMNNELFSIYKLRSMVTDAEKDGAKWSQKNDPRITSFGKFLRATRIDEFPQLFNVLRGDMSIIGPRPERPEFVKMLTEKLPFYQARHVIKPGLTGWAQVNADYGSSEADSLQKLQYDLYYIKHRSFILDLRIIIKTLSTVLFFRGR